LWDDPACFDDKTPVGESLWIILSAAKDLLFGGQRQILRCAQDDTL
jgi:hypothetical protein